jgi:hypothetical protein
LALATQRATGSRSASIIWTRLSQARDKITVNDETETEIAIATATKARTAQWTCARCEMTSTWTHGLERGKLPPNWVREKDGRDYCLACQRERAAEQALQGAGELGLEGRAKVRSAAVVEFEIRRDPDRTEGEIASAASASVLAVRNARRRLGSRRAPR